MSFWSKISGNVAQLLTATAFTSFTFHLLFARREAVSERARHTARISILESLIARLKQGEHIENSEIEKLMALSRKLQRGGNDDFEDLEHQRRANVSWKEVFIGKRPRG